MKKLKISPSKILFIVAIAIIVILLLQLNGNKNKSEKELIELRKSIIASDRLTKEADGRYAKLVNYYASESDLKNQLKNLNNDLYNTIKSQDERLMSITDAVITLESELTAGFGSIDTRDTSNVNLALQYPKKGDPFVFWNGKVNRYTAEYNGEFTFGRLPIQIVVTEESRGLWKHRIVGPEWLRVDSLTINSIPPGEYTTVKPKNLQWLFGGTYNRSFSSNIPSSIGLGVGLSLFNSHNIIFGANSASQVSIGYYYKLKSVKRK
jgi:hypothetical protein